MQNTGLIIPKITDNFADDSSQRVKSADAIADSSDSGFMMLDHQTLVRRISLAIAMLQQFSTGDHV